MCLNNIWYRVRAFLEKDDIRECYYSEVLAGSR